MIHTKTKVLLSLAYIPEFEFEKDKNNVEAAVKRNHIFYPVALDNNYKTWSAFSNMYWPAHYLIDRNGIIRQFHFGEGSYTETENAIRQLLDLPPLLTTGEPTALHRPITPETYLGYTRGSGYIPEIKLKEDQTAVYSYTATLNQDEVGIKGKWLAGPENILAEGDDSSLELDFKATRVYLVLGGESKMPINVKMDGKPLPNKYYTADMDEQGQIFVKEPRKYDIVNLHGDYGTHRLSLHIPKGITAYAFTFGDEP